MKNKDKTDRPKMICFLLINWTKSIWADQLANMFDDHTPHPLVENLLVAMVKGPGIRFSQNFAQLYSNFPPPKKIMFWHISVNTFQNLTIKKNMHGNSLILKQAEFMLVFFRRNVVISGIAHYSTEEPRKLKGGNLPFTPFPSHMKGSCTSPEIKLLFVWTDHTYVHQ